MEANAIPFDHTLPGVDQRVTSIEQQRAAEAEAVRLNEAATKGDIKDLNDRFNGLIKAIWAVAAMLATAGLTILTNHL